MNIRTYAKRLVASSGLVVLTLATLTSGASAVAVSKTASAGTGTNTPAQTQRIQVIIGKGDQEINRRLTALGKLNTKITSAAKLTASDKTDLTNEVTTETGGLTALKTKLDADIDLATVKTDVQSIFDEYRVYALVLPKVALIKTADDQQVTEAKLTALATKLQTAITAKQTAGKNVASLQTQLTDMTTKTAAATAISNGIETSVIDLQPTDYNSNHAVLSGDATQLKAAHADNLAAYNDAKSIATALKTL